MSERYEGGHPGVGYWDESLREAKACGEVLVMRGEVKDGSFELDVVALREGVADPYLDACERVIWAS